MTYVRDHDTSCLMRRYCELPERRREWWPVDFSGRPALCTCNVYPHSEAHRPEWAMARQGLEEYLNG